MPNRPYTARGQLLNESGEFAERVRCRHWFSAYVGEKLPKYVEFKSRTPDGEYTERVFTEVAMEAVCPFCDTLNRDK